MKFKRYKTKYRFLSDDLGIMSKINSEYHWKGSEEEITAIYIYTNDKNSYINKYFRFKEDLWETKIIAGLRITPKILKDFITYFDSVCNKNNLIQDTLLFRGIENVDFIEEFYVGGTFTENGYCSCSFDIEIAKYHSKDNWLMTIEGKKGLSGGYLEIYTDDQGEIEYILPRMTSFIITNIDYNEKIITLVPV